MAKTKLSPSQQFAIFSFAVLLVLGSVLAWFLSRQIELEIISAISEMIGNQVKVMIRPQLAAADLAVPMTGHWYRRFDAFLHENILSEQVARVKIWNKHGVIIYADDPTLIGHAFPIENGLRQVYQEEQVATELASLEEAENVSELGLGPLLEIYIPLVPRDSQEVLGAYEVYLYYEPIAATVRQTQAWIWSSVAIALVGLWLSLFWVYQRAQRAIEHQRKLAITDPLTGLHNRRYLLEQLQVEMERARRYGVPLSLILLDLDHFKEYNDRYGHQAGDAALREVAWRILASVRRLDTVARFGGEEFAVLLPATELAGAIRTAERIRDQIAKMPFDYGPLTVSLGVAEYRGQPVNEFIAEADAALYQAKREGRNQVCVAGERP